jgi:hypothetical protein
MLGRHDFKNQRQDLLLQLVQVRNGVNHAADFEQRVQIALQPGCYRQFLQDAIGLKIENILRADLRSGLSNGVVELHGFHHRFLRVFFFFFVQEHKNRFSY